MLVTSSPVSEGKYDYLKDRKKVYAIFICNTKTLLPLTLDEQTNKKRYASTGNRTHEQDWFTLPVL